MLMKACYLLTTVVLTLASVQGVKEHKCGICGREFTLLANMKRHVLIHTNIRAYQCHLCYKSFVQKQTLKAHMIVHSDVKPFKCKVGWGGARGSAEREGSEGCAPAGGRVSREGIIYSVSSEGPLTRGVGLRPTPGPSAALRLSPPPLCPPEPWELLCLSHCRISSQGVEAASTGRAEGRRPIWRMRS